MSNRPSKGYSKKLRRMSAEAHNLQYVSSVGRLRTTISRRLCRHLPRHLRFLNYTALYAPSNGPVARKKYPNRGKPLPVSPRMKSRLCKPK